MNEQSDIASLVRAVRGRVPMDAAQMLVKETPERIGAVFAELPPILVDRIKSYLPPELRSQAAEFSDRGHREHRGRDHGSGARRPSADDDSAAGDRLSARLMRPLSRSPICTSPMPTTSLSV